MCRSLGINVSKMGHPVRQRTREDTAHSHILDQMQICLEKETVRIVRLLCPIFSLNNTVKNRDSRNRTLVCTEDTLESLVMTGMHRQTRNMTGMYFEYVEWHFATSGFHEESCFHTNRISEMHWCTSEQKNRQRAHFHPYTSRLSFVQKVASCFSALRDSTQKPMRATNYQVANTWGELKTVRPSVNPTISL